MRMAADRPQARLRWHRAQMPVDRPTDVGRVAQHAAHSRRIPLALASPWLAAGRRQAAADLAQAQPLKRDPAEDLPDDACLLLNDLEPRLPTTIRLRHVAITIRRRGKGTDRAGTRSMPATAAATLQDFCSLVLRDHALHLQQEVILSRATNRVIEEDHLGAGTAELLDEQNLVGIAPCEAVRGVDVEASHQARGNRVAQPLQRRAHQSCPAVSLVDVDVLRQHAIALGRDPLVQRSNLTDNSVVTRLLVRRYARIECNVAVRHGYLRTCGWGRRSAPASCAWSCRRPRIGSEPGGHTHRPSFVG